MSERVSAVFERHKEIFHSIFTAQEQDQSGQVWTTATTGEEIRSTTRSTVQG